MIEPDTGSPAMEPVRTAERVTGQAGLALGDELPRFGISMFLERE